MKRIIPITAGLALAATIAVASEVAPENVVFDDYGAVAESISGAPGDVANEFLINKDASPQLVDVQRLRHPILANEVLLVLQKVSAAYLDSRFPGAT